MFVESLRDHFRAKLDDLLLIAASLTYSEFRKRSKLIYKQIEDAGVKTPELDVLLNGWWP